jgi:hypothetical protein
MMLRPTAEVSDRTAVGIVAVVRVTEEPDVAQSTSWAPSSTIRPKYKIYQYVND